MRSILGFAFVATVAVAWSGAVDASCAAPFLITSIDGPIYSEIFTPGVPAGSGYRGSTITGNLDGFFWALGYGDPVIGKGIDNGTFAPIGGEPAWMYLYPDYPAGILTTWTAAFHQMDFPCPAIMGPLGSRCMGMLLTDVDPVAVEPVFAFLSQHDDPASGDFYFVQPGGAPIVLAPLLPPHIVSSSSEPDGGAYKVTVTLAGPAPQDLLAGAYLSDREACRGAEAEGSDPLNGLFLGYRLHRQVLPRDAPVPTDFRRASWQDTLLPVVPLNQTVVAEAFCLQESDVYFAYSLIVDSEFQTSVVSLPSVRIECGPNVAEPPPRRRFRRGGRAER